MATTYTDLTTSTGSLGAEVVLAAYDRYLEMELRHMPILRALADKRPVQVDKPGDSVTFQLYQDLDPVTSTLTENVDPTAVAVPATTNVVVTLEEYGNAVVKTKLLREFALSDIDPAVANMVAFNMVDSLDGFVRTELSGGTNVRYANGIAGPTNTVNNSDVIKSDDVRYIVTKLRTNAAVPKRNGQLYSCHIHPDVAYDLRRETGEIGWRFPHNYAAPGLIWTGETGVYEGAFFVESARMLTAADGEATATVYRTIFTGQQALAEAVAVEPHFEINGPIGADKLRRFESMGWYGVLGWKRYREAALYRLESGSSINGADEV